MVESQFEQDSQISTDSPLVLVKAAEKTSAIQQLLDYISNYQMISSNSIPIKSMDKIMMLKLDDIILVDVNQTTLKIYTLTGVFTTTETLVHFANRLNKSNFIQISKHALIISNIKSSVSLKYVKVLMTQLGI